MVVGGLDVVLGLVVVPGGGGEMVVGGLDAVLGLVVVLAPSLSPSSKLRVPLVPRSCRPPSLVVP